MYPAAGDTKLPKSAGPKPIVASQKMKNVDNAYERREIGEFLVTIVVHAEFNVPKPRATQTAHINTVICEGAQAIKKIPMLWARIPTTQIIMSPYLS